MVQWKRAGSLSGRLWRECEQEAGLRAGSQKGSLLKISVFRGGNALA
jgi:hypothetical protein